MIVEPVLTQQSATTKQIPQIPYLKSYLITRLWAVEFLEDGGWVETQYFCPLIFIAGIILSTSL